MGIKFGNFKSHLTRGGSCDQSVRVHHGCYHRGGWVLHLRPGEPRLARRSLYEGGGRSVIPAALNGLRRQQGRRFNHCVYNVFVDTMVAILQ